MWPDLNWITASDCFMYLSEPNFVEISFDSGNYRYSQGPAACLVRPDHYSGSHWWLSLSFRKPICWFYVQQPWGCSWNLLWRSLLRTASSCMALSAWSFPRTYGWHWSVRILTGSTAASRYRSAQCTLPLCPVCPEIKNTLLRFIDNIFPFQQSNWP